MLARSRIVRLLATVLALLLAGTYLPLGCSIQKRTSQHTFVTTTTAGSQELPEDPPQVTPSVVVLNSTNHPAAAACAAAIGQRLNATVIPYDQLPLEAIVLPDLMVIVELIEVEDLHLPLYHRLHAELNVAVGETPRRSKHVYPIQYNRVVEVSCTFSSTAYGLNSRDLRFAELADQVAENVVESEVVEEWRPRGGKARTGGEELVPLPFELGPGHVHLYTGARPGITCEELHAVDSGGPYDQTLGRWAEALRDDGWEVEEADWVPYTVAASKGRQGVQVLLAHDRNSPIRGEPDPKRLSVLRWVEDPQ